MPVERRRIAVRADIVAGAVFPDYELTDHAKSRRRLSELQGIDPITAANGQRDRPVAIGEDVVAVGGGFLVAFLVSLAPLV